MPVITKKMRIEKKGDHFAGSIDFDNEDKEWEDYQFTANTYKGLIFQFGYWLDRKHNSSVFFAVKVEDDKEIDITDRVKQYFKIKTNVGEGFAHKDLKPMDW